MSCVGHWRAAPSVEDHGSFRYLHIILMCKYGPSVRHTLTGALLGALALTLTACATPGASDPTSSADASATGADHDHESDHDTDTDESDTDESGAVEAAAATPRLVLTYDGGLLVVDAATLDEVADLPLAGFTRVNAAGDGRHVLVSAAGGWQVLDAGAWTRAHGDHSHHYTAAPRLTDLLVEADEPGHVVVHDDLTTLFDDGTGAATVLPADGWTDAVEVGDLAPTRTWTAPAPHHGVAVASADGILLVTRGTEEARTGAALLDASDAELAVSDDCPGVHGEGAANEDVGEAYLVVGCENGLLAFHGDHVHKITSPDAFGRIGNAFGTGDSAVVLTDYKTDPEGGIGLDAITLTDVAAETMTIVDIGDAQYTWRGLARGEDGEALVLGTDGDLRVLDPATGALVRSIEVIGDWEVPQEWQTAHPALTVLDGMAFVTDPATQSIHAVDYVGGTVWRSAELSHATNELAGVTG